MTTPAIEFSSVELSLGAPSSRVHILRSVSFSIARGEAVGIVGPSGSGKSTLLMIMAGLEKPDSGSVKISGQEISGLGEDELAKFRGAHIGIVFQSFYLIPTMTALENIAIPLELAGRSDAYDKARAELEAVGLSARAHHFPRQLSGGEQQRIAIARALAPDSPILIADEPTGNLDESTGASIVRLLFDLQERRNTTLVLVTHDNDLAARCQRRISIRSGRIDAIDDLATRAMSRAAEA